METKTTKYLSLFDYLGYPAGRELGKEVFNLSKILGEKIQIKKVKNPKYQGIICCYSPEFLNYIFTLPRVYQYIKPKQ